MPNPDEPTIGPGATGDVVAALARIQGVKVDEAAIRAHVMRPENVVGVISYWGREDAPMVTLSAYQAFVKANLFSPAGVTGPTLYHEPADALAYNSWSREMVGIRVT
jgi:hypothetical protein